MRQLLLEHRHIKVYHQLFSECPVTQLLSVPSKLQLTFWIHTPALLRLQSSCTCCLLPEHFCMCPSRAPPSHPPWVPWGTCTLTSCPSPSVCSLIMHQQWTQSSGFQILAVKSFWGVSVEGCWLWIRKQGLSPVQRPLLKYKVQTMKMKSNKKRKIWALNAS